MTTPRLTAPMAPEGHKGCSHCQEIKPATMEFFRPAPRMRSGLASWCRECSSNLDKERYVDGRRKAQIVNSWRSHNLRKYGITEDTYNAILLAQGGLCAICQGPAVGHGSHLDVDHDHTSGRVRGLLCTRCNRAIGLLRDDPALFARAIDYLAVIPQDPPVDTPKEG